jgi:hypothetical protein
MALGEINLIPAQINGFSHAQAMPSHDEDQGGIAGHSLNQPPITFRIVS